MAKDYSKLIRSSSAEYLTFSAATGAGSVDGIYSDENIWLTQKMMGTLYPTSGFCSPMLVLCAFGVHRMKKEVYSIPLGPS